MKVEINLDEHETAILNLLVDAEKDDTLTADLCAEQLFKNLLNRIWADYTAENTTPC